MPFKSKAQLRKFGAMVESGEISKATFNKWAKHTKNIKGLPEKKSRLEKRKILRKVKNKRK